MAAAALSIKLRCASWQQLATIYKRDLSRGSMFLKASTPPDLGTTVRIDLTLPSASVVVLTGTVERHVNDPQRGAGVELKLAPIPSGTTWMIETALAAEQKVRAPTSPGETKPPASATISGPVLAITEGAEVAEAENELIKALMSEADSLRKLNPFLVLGLGYEATDADVRAAFGELTKRYHPDRFARYQSTELRQVAAEIFILIRDAYRKLGDEAARAQVLGTLGRQTRSTPRSGTQALPRMPQQIPQKAEPPPAPTTPSGPQFPRAATPPPVTAAIPRVGPPPPPQRVPPPPPPAAPRESEPVIARPATPLPVTDQRSGPVRAPTSPIVDNRSGPIRVGTPAPIVDVRSGPVRMPPPPVATERKPVLNSPPPVLTEATDATALEELLDSGKIDEALGAYKVMAKKFPQDRAYRAGIELCEGFRAVAARDRLEAAQRFEAALEIDPSNERAARELAEMRRQATNERKGLLSRLMGKKDGSP